MKIIRRDLPTTTTKIELIPLADLHTGDRCCDMKAIQRLIDYIRDTPNAYCVLNGDLMDTAIATSIGDTYGAVFQPMEQLDRCVELFGPIKDKILCITPGNHENRVYKSDGIDTTALMAAQLNISETYTDTTALLFLRLGQANGHGHNRPIRYTVYVTHGAGGGRKEGGKVNRLADLSGIVDADIYIHSHTHLPVVFKEAFYRTGLTNSSVEKVTRLFVNTSGFLDYGGYGDRGGYKPNAIDNPIIYLDGTKKDAKAML